MDDLKPSPDMSPEEFRAWGYKFVDWIADYLAHPERYPVLSQVEPGSIRRRLPPTPPEKPEPMADMLRDVEQIIVPGITHWNHPAFFAYFAVTGSGPGILGELLSAAFNVNGMLWRTSPAFTELEEHVLDWLRQMLRLPSDFKGIVYDTASTSTFHAFAAAREFAGEGASQLRAYTSNQAHSSVEKAAMAIGLGRSGIVKIGVDDEFRMEPVALEAAIKKDRDEGRHPFCVSATIGTTSTTSIDPVPRIADICEKYRLWLHVDAAYAGAAAILPEMRWILDGCERADSFVMNPHKWLFTPIDFSAFYCRRPHVLKQAFSLTPEYLQTTDPGSVTNYMDYGMQLGRRFRSLKFWMVVRYFGVEGLRERIREHIRLGKLFASWVAADSRFEIIAPVPFSTVCFRLIGDDSANQELMDRVNATGKIFISHTRLNNRVVLRFTVGNLRSSEEHVRMAWDLIRHEAS
jgi:aromatic-L-amino-acid/L-tryptophan decarboxylase